MTKGAPRRSRFLSPGWLMFGSALLCVVLVPVVHAAMNYSGEKQERYRQLAAMTKSERLKIEHAFAEFQKLTPAEQESFRALDRQLETEQITLKSTLSDYQEFLSSLSPVDRAELDRATTKSARLIAIESIQDARARRQQQLETGITEFEQGLEEFRSREDSHRFQVFSPAEMEDISKIIEGKLPTDVKSKVNLDSFSGAARFAATMAAAVQAWGPSKVPALRRELFAADVLQEIEPVIKNEEIRKSFTEAENDQERSHKLRWYAYSTMRRAHFESYPETSELYTFLETLEPEEKEKLMSKDPRRMYIELANMYLEKKKPPIVKAFKLFPAGQGPNDMWWGGRPGSRGSDGNGPDRRGDGERRGGPDGDRPFRGQQGDFRRERGPGEERRFGERPRPNSETPPAGAE